MSEDGATPRVLHLVFTDVVESAALKQTRGDQAAAELLDRERAELVRLAAECNGRIVDFAGDGCFLTFETGSAAVLMGLRLQQLHASQPDLPRVRVGIHVGEVSERAQPAGERTPRVEGLAVDLAARIQGLARPGQVLVSAAVATSVRQRLSHEVEGRTVRWQSHGRYRLKGSSEPVDVFEVGLEGIAPFAAPHAGDKARRVSPRGPALALGVTALVAATVLGYLALRMRTSPALAPIRAIAVLPLENLSGDPEQEYFADGMTDAMIGELAKISALKVISRTSVMQYKGAHRPLREIARELGVEGVIEGTVLRAGEQVRITAQLIDARSDHHLWAESYERDLAAVLQIQSEVARAVAGRIEIALSPHEAARLAPPKPVNPRAQDAYLRGRQSQGRLTLDGTRSAIDFYEEAIRIDPEHAPAHAGLSLSTFLLTWLFQGVSMHEAVPKARSEALRALALDDRLEIAHRALGQVLFRFDWDWAAAEREFLRAIELGRSDGALSAYANYLDVMGRHEKALALSDEAVAVSPFDLIRRVTRASILLNAGMYEEVLAATDAMLAADPNYWIAFYYRSYAFRQLGRYEESLGAERRWAELQPARAVAAAELERGWREGGQDGYNRALKRESERAGDLDTLAVVDAAMGDADGAFEALELAYERRSPLLVNLIADVGLKPLHKDPRFADLARRMNLPVPEDATTH